MKCFFANPCKEYAVSDVSLSRKGFAIASAKSPKPQKIFSANFSFQKLPACCASVALAQTERRSGEWVEGLSPVRAVRNPCRLVDEQAAPQAKNGGWV
jgi:hypothetical protein